MTNPSTVALTGASGFVGGHILTKLLTAGHKVRVLVRHPYAFEPRVSNAKLTSVVGSLFDDQALATLVTGVDAVIHVVGIITERPGEGQTFDRIHIDGTRQLLKAAQQARVSRWIHMSALGTRPEAHSRYHFTKWHAEKSVRESNLKYTIFRPSIIHGPDGEFMKMVKAFWCRLMPPFVPYFGAGPFGTEGAGRLQPVWVQDVARCFCEALDKDKTINETYPLGGPDTYTWPQLYEICHGHLPRARSKKVFAVPVWLANIMAGLPGVPFNKDQVIMSQEDSVCNLGKVRSDFGFELAAFEPTLAKYAGQIR